MNTKDPAESSFCANLIKVISIIGMILLIVSAIIVISDGFYLSGISYIAAGIVSGACGWGFSIIVEAAEKYVKGGNVPKVIQTQTQAPAVSKNMTVDEKIRSLKKGEYISLKGFSYIYAGMFQGKYCFYPRGASDSSVSRYIVKEEVGGDYLGLTPEQLKEII